jgi:hypothetical protein
MEPSMHPPVMTGFLVILAVSGCASMRAPSPGAEREVTPAAAPPAPAAQPVAPPTAAPPSVPEPANNGSDQSSASADIPDTAAPPSSVKPAKRSSPAKTTSASGTRPPKQTGAAAAQSRPSVLPAAPAAASAPSPSSAAPPAPTLDLADLEQRLRETRAIGVFTKLSLKNQVYDLLNAFRTLYRGPDKHPPAELRQRYDLLLIKVLTLLQDGDPPLAAAIASSREAIWSILADPEKFATI